MGLPVFAMDKSAEVLMGVISVSWLLSGFGSGVVLLTVTVFVMVPTAVSFTIPRMMTVRDAPSARLPRPAEPVQGWKVNPPSSEYSGFLIWAGRESVSVTFCASPGPWLAATTV